MRAVSRLRHRRPERSKPRGASLTDALRLAAREEVRADLKRGKSLRTIARSPSRQQSRDQPKNGGSPLPRLARHLGRRAPAGGKNHS